MRAGENPSSDHSRTATAPRSAIRAVVFDFDGVILESVEIKTEAFAALFSHRPEHVPAIVKLHRDNAGMSRYEKFDRIHRDILHEPMRDGDSERLGEEFSRLVFEKILVCDFVPGAVECLESLARDRRLFVASATPEEEVREIVKRRGLAELFSSVYGSPATKSAILGRILEHDNLAPREAVFVGDARADYDAALAVGVPFVGRVPEGQSAPFPADGPAATIRDLRELTPALADL